MVVMDKQNKVLRPAKVRRGINTNSMLAAAFFLTRRMPALLKIEQLTVCVHVCCWLCFRVCMLLSTPLSCLLPSNSCGVTQSRHQKQQSCPRHWDTQW